MIRKVQIYLPLACGWEISVPATKTYTNQVIALIALALVAHLHRPTDTSKQPD